MQKYLINSNEALPIPRDSVELLLIFNELLIANERRRFVSDGCNILLDWSLRVLFWILEKSYLCLHELWKIFWEI